MTAHFDAGPVLMQRLVRIGPDDNRETAQIAFGLVMGEISVAAYHLLSLAPDSRGLKQDESRASYATPREAARRIAWIGPAAGVRNLVRGLAPYPCAIFSHEGNELQVADVEVTGIPSDPDSWGLVRRTPDGKLLVGCADWFVKITKLRLGGQIVDDYATERGIRAAT